MYKVLESLTSHYGSAKRPIQRLAGERFNSGCSVSGLTGLTASQKAFLWWRIEHLQALPETIQATVLKVGNSQRCNYVKLVEIDLLCSKALSREETNPIQEKWKRSFWSFHKCTEISLSGGKVLHPMLSQISYSFLSPSSLRQNSTIFTTFLFFTTTWAILICIFWSSSSMKPNEIMSISDQLPGQVHGSIVERSRSGHGRSNTSINHLRERSIRRWPKWL